MERLADSGVWSCFVPGIGAGDRYRFAQVARMEWIKLRTLRSVR